MAQITAYTVGNKDQTWTVTWLAMGNADTGDGVAFSQFPDRTLQVTGTFAGATVTIQGSNDGGTTWSTLHDFLGNPLTFTAAGIALVAESPILLRPSTSGGGGSSINVIVVGTQL